MKIEFCPLCHFIHYWVSETSPHIFWNEKDFEELDKYVSANNRSQENP